MNTASLCVVATLTGLAAGCAAKAAERGSPVAEVVVVAPTPLPGGGVDPTKLPGVTESLDARDLGRTGSPLALDALQQHVAGASLSDPQSNAFARQLDFRGFQASPLQGTAQGLAVYLDGVRLNEAFGDTVNWDLVPEVALAGADLFTSNPAFGLNALGGAVSLRTKSGFDAPGGAAAVQEGGAGRVDGAVEQGVAKGPWATYVALDGGGERGWRPRSAVAAVRGLADLGWAAGPGELHLTVIAARDRLGVVGPTPADLLAQDRRAVFTSPQATRNRSGLAELRGALKLSAGWSLQGDLYLRALRQAHVDGNGADVEGCSRNPVSPLFATLCLQDDAFPAALRPPPAAFQVLGAEGAPVACPPLGPGQVRPCAGVPYGTVDRTRLRAATWGGGVQLTRSGAVIGLGNAFAAGFSLDRSRVRFDADSTLGVLQPDLSVSTAGTTPGVGQVIRTGGALAYSPIALRAVSTTLGLYATDTLDLTPSLSLTLSGRFNAVRTATGDLSGTNPALDAHHRFDRFNPAAGLAWRLAPGLSLYGGYAEASRTPTPLELACSDPARPCLLENALVADPPLKAVVARSWEAGLRGARRTAGGALSARVGLFQSDSHNDILALASQVQGRGFYANAPRTRRRGVEASAEYRGGGWSAYAAYSHVQATYRFAADLPSPNSPFADDHGDVHVRPGDRIAGIPSDRLKLGGDLEVTRTVSVGADLLATGRQRLAGDEANQDASLGAYWTANLHASWRLIPRLTLSARAENLFNRRAPTFGTYFETDTLAGLSPSRLPPAPDPRTYVLEAPRAVSLGLRAVW